MRYKLKKGKFGCYFYDSVILLDLTLEMVLNKLNDIKRLDKKLTNYIMINLEQSKKINTLQKEIEVLKHE